MSKTKTKASGPYYVIAATCENTDTATVLQMTAIAKWATEAEALSDCERHNALADDRSYFVASADQLVPL